MRRIRLSAENVLNRIQFRYWGIQCKSNAGKIEGVLTIRSGKKGSISIGEKPQFRSGKRYNIIGGDTRLILRTVGEGKIRIGNRVGISNSALVSMSQIELQDDVMIGGSCKLYDTDFHSISYEKRMDYPDPDIRTKPILIKQGAFIGAHTIILKGVTIGCHSVVGAGSVVTHSIPDGELWGGGTCCLHSQIG